MQDRQLWKLWRRLQVDERGSGVEQIFLIGLIVIPLVLVLVTFKDKVLDFLKTQFTKVLDGDSAHDPFGR